MNERRLGLKLRLIAGLTVPLPLSLGVSGCGGNVEVASRSGDGGRGGSGGSAGADGPAGAGGANTGETAGTGGSVGTAGIGGAIGTAGAGGAIGTAGMGGAIGTAGAGGADCNVPARNGTAPDCVSPTYYELAAACQVANPTREQCLTLCNTNWAVSSCQFLPSSNPEKVMLQCPPTCVAGRRPAGFAENESTGSGLTAYLARAAELEAAAVHAFQQLRADLAARHAPRPLLRALSRAARDERRHTRATRAMARRHGALVREPAITSCEVRSLEAIAVENVREGCVRELYGALVATFQAEHAREPELRRLMRRIAHEETRHAALSERVQRWLDQRLDGHARARVRAAREVALTELSQQLDHPVDPTLCERAGLPSREHAKQLFGALFVA